MTLERILERRQAVLEQHRIAVTTVEQTRGALIMLDQMIEEMRAGTNGAAEATDDVEATSSTERIISS